MVSDGVLNYALPPHWLYLYIPVCTDGRILYNLGAQDQEQTPELLLLLCKLIPSPGPMQYTSSLHSWFPQSQA